MKYVMSILLLAVASVLLLTGCGESYTPPAQDEEALLERIGTPILEPTTITRPENSDTFPFNYPFTVLTPEWIVDWSYSTDTPQLFSFTIYRRSEVDRPDVPVISLLGPQARSGTYHSYGGWGNYYIDIFAGYDVEWEITITPIETATTEDTVWVISEPVTITGPTRPDIRPCTYPFTVLTRQWIVHWSYSTDEQQAAPFQFYIYRRGILNPALGPELSFTDLPTSGTYHSYSGDGEFYIDVYPGFDVEWEITITPVQ